MYTHIAAKDIEKLIEFIKHKMMTKENVSITVYLSKEQYIL